MSSPMWEVTFKRGVKLIWFHNCVLTQLLSFYIKLYDDRYNIRYHLSSLSIILTDTWVKCVIMALAFPLH